MSLHRKWRIPLDSHSRRTKMFGMSGQEPMHDKHPKHP